MKFTSLPWSLRALVLAALATADSLPYNPGRILTTTNSTYAYYFTPLSASSNQAALTALDLSQEFGTNSISWKEVTDGLPFLQDESLLPYTPFIDESGNITVIAGSCTGGADKTQVWRLAPGADGTGSWTQLGTSDRDLPVGSNLTGTNYLANGVAFSSSADDLTDTSFYLFGGMCPFSTGNDSDWAANAAYANSMLTFTPERSSDGTTLDISSIAARGPPVAEAGFTMTGLNPSYSMNSSGHAQSRQQDFLLLGGHTQTAFINMSHVALFSLPQESWSFVDIEQPVNSKTDLAARQDSAIVEPRSGHTAVLSADGGSVIVVGGWVGDISNAAQPQIAILHLGSEYGGDASQEWTWSIPSPSGNMTPAGDGIYGHGATMLPGGVMLIAGGYSISSSTSKSKRASQTPNEGVYLFNTTSNAWIDSYVPAIATSAAESNGSSGALSKTSQQAGLGVGLGVGAIGVAGLICFYFWYSRRLRRQREERTRELVGGHSEVSIAHIHQPFLDRGGIDGRGGDAQAGNSSVAMAQAGSTGLSANIPSPTRGLRKGLANRPYSYHAAPQFDGRRNIHPIIEQADEDVSIRGDDMAAEESHAVQSLRPLERAYDNNPQEDERKLRDLQRSIQARSYSLTKDPFSDPEPNPLGSHPVSPAEGVSVRRVPTGASRYERSPTRRPLSAEMDGSMNWMIVEDPDVPSDPSSSSNGRTSPTRSDDRTSSTLSERSQRSQASTNSITRTMSTRTGALLAAALAARRGAKGSNNGAWSPLEERTSTMGTLSSTSDRASPYSFYNTDQVHATSTRPDAFYAPQMSAESFRTARTTLAQLQEEGQSLLGGRPMLDRDDPYQRAMAATSANMGKQPVATDLVPPMSSLSRRQGWVGSLRRALTIMSNSDRTSSLTGSAAGRHEEEPEFRTSSSSPIRNRRRPVIDGPRRTVSDGAHLKHKRGQSDWEKENRFPNPYYDDPDLGDWGEGRDSLDEKAAENEWDVESAANKRDVQLMFTIPKARLRVVNADVERASMRSASDSAVSRAGSLKKQESHQTLRSRSDEKEKMIPLTPTFEEMEQGLSTAREARE